MWFYKNYPSLIERKQKTSGKEGVHAATAAWMWAITCWPGLMGESVMPWVLITGRIWFPMTVAMIWPWALVRSWGVMGCTCRP